MILMVQPSLAVGTWRTMWPAEELRRRGYDVQTDVMSGYGPEVLPVGALTVVHLTPSLWARPEWIGRVRDARERADRFVVSLDDDWTRLEEA